MSHFKAGVAVLSMLAVLGGCSSAWLNIDQALPLLKRSKYGNPESYEVFGQRYYVLKTNKGFRQTGIASWYGKDFHGKRASSGEPYNMYAMTAAHKTLIIPVYVEVENLDNGRRVIVKVNDRGPFKKGRIIDMSYAAAKELGMAEAGTARVAVRVIERMTRQISAPVLKPSAVQSSASPQSAPTTKSSVTTESAIFIQVGVFSEHENAQKIFSALLSSFDEGVLLSRVKKDQQTVYRVRIGPLDNQAAADAVIERLKEKGLSNILLITD